MVGEDEEGDYEEGEGEDDEDEEDPPSGRHVLGGEGTGQGEGMHTRGSHVVATRRRVSSSERHHAQHAITLTIFDVLHTLLLATAERKRKREEEGQPGRDDEEEDDEEDE